MAKSKPRNAHAIDDVSVPKEAFALLPDMSLAIKTMNRVNQANLRYIQDCNAECADFVSRRLKEDFVLSERFAKCKSPVDAWRVWADFYLTAFGQYQEELARIARMTQDAREEIIRPVDEECDKDGAVSKHENQLSA